MDETNPLLDKLNADFKLAMKSGDKLKLETLRSLRAVLKEKEIALRGQNRPMSGEDILAAIAGAAKKRKEAIGEYEKAGRTELAETERKELGYIQEYLPAQLSPEEIEAEISSVMGQLGASSPKDMGRVMSAAMSKLRGKADGKAVQSIVKRLLEST